MNALQFLLTHMKSPVDISNVFQVDISHAAYRSFREICDACKNNLTQMASTLASLFQQCDASTVGVKNRVLLAESTGEILQSIRPIANQLEPVLSIILPISAILNELIASVTHEHSSHTLAQHHGEAVVSQFQYINAILSCIHPMKENVEEIVDPMTDADVQAHLRLLQAIMNLLWPIIIRSLDVWCRDEAVMQVAVTIVIFSESR